jgi:hypothetical protein
MRTTLTLDDDVYQAAATLARGSGKTVGKVLSELARRGLAPRPTKERKGDALPTFDVPKDAPLISLEAVRRAWEED